MRYENGRSISGSSILVEWAKGSPRTGPVSVFDFQILYFPHIVAVSSESLLSNKTTLKVSGCSFRMHKMFKHWLKV